MKRSLAAIIVFLHVLFIEAQTMWQFKKDTVITWKYSSGDEFNEDKIDLNYWKSIGSVRSLFTNKEQQYYTDGANHYCTGGSLKLTAKKDTVIKRNIDWKNDNDSLVSETGFYGPNKRQFNYTAGKLISQQTFNKGFFECRFKLPSQPGYWPAFWLYGGSPNEEIDIMECKSEKSKQIHFDTHCANHCDYVNLLFQKRSYGGWMKTKFNFVEGFNIVACKWDETDVRFYLNGECVGVSKVKFDVEKHIAINIAVPSNDGPFHPGPSEKDTTTAIYEIDYIRIWNKSSPTFKGKQKAASTFIDTVKPIITTSKIKSKGKLTYGKKADHNDDGVIITYFKNVDFIQLQALGIFNSSKPTYTIKSSEGKQILKVEIDNQIFNIVTSSFPKGDYVLIINYGGKEVRTGFTL